MYYIDIREILWMSGAAARTGDFKRKKPINIYKEHRRWGC